MLLTIIGLVGITNIITRSYIFEKVRDNLPFAWLRYLAQCPACSGTWVGFLWYIIAVCTYDSWRCIPLMFVWGGVVSVCSAVVVACLDYINYAKTDLINKIMQVPGEKFEE